MLRRENIGLRNSELLIIIPAYNESGNIEKTIKMIEDHTPEFDYVIINDDFNKALHDLEAVIIANRLALHQQANRHEKLIQALITPSEE